MSFNFAKILVPVSFSPRSKRALEVGGSLAEHYGADLMVIHVIHDPFGTEGLHMAYVYVKEEEWQAHRKKVKEELHALIQEKIKAGVTVKEDILEGDPTRKILEIIKSEKVDLLVLHHHPGGWLDRFLTGHDTNRLAQDAPCNVFMVHNPSGE